MPLLIYPKNNKFLPKLAELFNYSLDDRLIYTFLSSLILLLYFTDSTADAAEFKSVLPHHVSHS